MPRPINVFIIYAREDHEIKRRLLAHLNPFVKAFNLNIWHDDHLEAGQEWKPHITSRLNVTDIFLLLVSIDFMNSEFINKIEFRYAVQKHKENKSIIVPIIVNYCQWDIDTIFDDDSRFNLSELQVLPDQALPIDGWKTPEQAFNNIAAGVRKLLTSIKINLTQQEVQENTKTHSPSVILLQSSPQQDDKQEEIDWAKADEEKTTDAYYSFLKKYPNGKYKTAASRALRILEDLIIRKQKNEKEDALWEIACISNTVSSYEEYLKNTELGLYKDQANDLVQHREKEEDLLWNIASKEKAIPAYETYLQNYPKGKYAEKASEAIRNLETAMEEEFLWRQTVKENTPASYKSYLRQTTLGKYTREAQNAIQNIAGKERQKKEEISCWNNAQQNNSIIGYQNYVNTYPDGNFTTLATSALKNLEENKHEEDLWSQTKKENTIDSYNYYLEKSTQGKYKEAADSAIQTLKAIHEQKEQEEKSPGNNDIQIVKLPMVEKNMVSPEIVQKSGEATAEKLFSQKLLLRGIGIAVLLSVVMFFFLKKINVQNNSHTDSPTSTIYHPGTLADSNSASADSMLAWGKKYSEKNPQEAFGWCEKAAEKGNTEAMFILGTLYHYGYAVTQSYPKAIEWSEKAAENGNSDAMSYLGFIYYYGVGVEQDMNKGMQWYQKAAEKGNGRAMNDLGTIYYNGAGVTQSYTKAKEWYEKAAAAGDIDAQKRLNELNVDK